MHKGQRVPVQVVVLRADGYQVLLRQRHLCHRRPREYTQKGQRVQVVVLRADGYQALLRQGHLRHGQPAEYTGVREYKWFYFELTDTRYLLFTQRHFIIGDPALHRGQTVQVVVLRADRYQELLRQRHLRHGRPAEYTLHRGQKVHVVVYSEQTDTRVLLRQRHLRHGRPAEYRGVREYTLLYSEKRDTRYFSDSVTFVTGDLQSTEGSESTHGCTQRRGIPGTSQTASPSLRATWRVHRGQRVQVVVLRADGYQVLLRQRHLCHGRPGEYTGVREYKWLYSEQTDTRYFSDSVTLVTGDLESTQGSESTIGGTQSRRTPGRYFSDSVTLVTGDLESTHRPTLHSFQQCCGSRSGPVGSIWFWVSRIRIH